MPDSKQPRAPRQLRNAAVTPAEQTRPRDRKLAWREAVIAAAVEEFALGGLHGTPVDRIARQAGVSQPYVFQLFATKRDLFIAAVERGFANVMDVFSQASSEFERTHGRQDYAPGDMLDALGASYLKLLAAGRPTQMFQLQAHAACDDEAVRQCVSAAYERLAHHMRDLTGATESEIDDCLRQSVWLEIQHVLKTKRRNGIPTGQRPQHLVPLTRRG